jgi:hypothetical protein
MGKAAPYRLEAAEMKKRAPAKYTRVSIEEGDFVVKQFK